MPQAIKYDAVAAEDDSTDSPLTPAYQDNERYDDTPKSVLAVSGEGDTEPRSLSYRRRSYEETIPPPVTPFSPSGLQRTETLKRATGVPRLRSSLRYSSLPDITRSPLPPVPEEEKLEDWMVVMMDYTAKSEPEYWDWTAPKPLNFNKVIDPEEEVDLYEMPGRSSWWTDIW